MAPMKKLRSTKPQPVAPLKGAVALSYPLTKKALASAFEPLNPKGIHVTKTPGWHEASVGGSWSLARLRAHFKSLGFRPTGRADALLFVNEARDVGFQCHGVEPHPTKNTWKTYCVEVQARQRPQDTDAAASQLF